MHHLGTDNSAPEASTSRNLQATSPLLVRAPEEFRKWLVSASSDAKQRLNPIFPKKQLKTLQILGRWIKGFLSHLRRGHAPGGQPDG